MKPYLEEAITNSGEDVSEGSCSPARNNLFTIETTNTNKAGNPTQDIPKVTIICVQARTFGPSSDHCIYMHKSVHSWRRRLGKATATPLIHSFHHKHATNHISRKHARYNNMGQYIVCCTCRYEKSHWRRNLSRKRFNYLKFKPATIKDKEF